MAHTSTHEKHSPLAGPDTRTPHDKILRLEGEKQRLDWQMARCPASHAGGVGWAAQAGTLHAGASLVSVWPGVWLRRRVQAYCPKATNSCCHPTPRESCIASKVPCKPSASGHNATSIFKGRVLLVSCPFDTSAALGRWSRMKVEREMHFETLRG
jgi:hypothetical protein